MLFRGGADSTGTGLTDLVTFQSDSSIVVAGLAGMGERALCVDANGELMICTPPMNNLRQLNTIKASQDKPASTNFVEAIKEQQIIIEDQQQEINDLNIRLELLEKIIMESNQAKAINKE